MDSPALASILCQSESHTEERDSHIVRGSVKVGTSVHAILELNTFYQASTSDADYGDKLQQKWRELRNRCGGLVYHWNSCPDLEDQTKERNYRQSVTGFACRALQETRDAANGRRPSLIITMLRRRVWTRPVAITGHIYQTTFCCFWSLGSQYKRLAATEVQICSKSQQGQR